MLRKLLKSTRAQLQIIFSLLIAAVSTLIGILVFYKISGAIATEDLSQIAKDTINNVITTAGSAFNLAPVILIVIVAAGILGLLIGWTSRRPGL